MNWKQITNTEYYVSDTGSVKNKHDNLLSIRLNTSGVPQVVLYKNNVRKECVVAVLVANAFLGKHSKDKKFVQHIDFDKTNNNVSNLKWATQRSIVNDSVKAGRRVLNSLKGAAGSRQVLSKPVIQYDLHGNFIREFENTRDVERCLGINHASISQCCRQKSQTSGGYKWRYKNQS